jgi:hypothetical protein
VWSFVWDQASGVTQLRERTAELTPKTGGTLDRISAFGEDGFGELYIIDRGLGATAGEVYRIVERDLRVFRGEVP